MQQLTKIQKKAALTATVCFILPFAYIGALVWGTMKWGNDDAGSIISVVLLGTFGAAVGLLIVAVIVVALAIWWDNMYTFFRKKYGEKPEPEPEPVKVEA